MIYQMSTVTCTEKVFISCPEGVLLKLYVPKGSSFCTEVVPLCTENDMYRWGHYSLGWCNGRWTMFATWRMMVYRYTQSACHTSRQEHDQQIHCERESTVCTQRAAWSAASEDLSALMSRDGMASDHLRDGWPYGELAVKARALQLEDLLRHRYNKVELWKHKSTHKLNGGVALQKLRDWSEAT